MMTSETGLYHKTLFPLHFEHKNDFSIIVETIVLNYEPEVITSVKFDNDCGVIFMLII